MSFDEEQRGEFDEWEREVAGLKQEMSDLRDQLTAVTEERDKLREDLNELRKEDRNFALLRYQKEMLEGQRNRLLENSVLKETIESAACWDKLCEWLDGAADGREVTLVNANPDFEGPEHSMYYSTDFGQTQEQVFGDTRAECLRQIEEATK